MARLKSIAQRIDKPILLVIALSLFAWAPLTAPGYFLKAHDAPHSIFFLTEFDQAIRDGVLWPRWGIDFALGYGYPLFNFYAPLVFFVAETFHLLGAGLTGAVKLTYLVTFISSALAMYAFVGRLWNKTAGVLAATVYTYAPYHLVDIYVRSSLAEFFAFIFFPLALLFFQQLVETRQPRYVVLAGMTYAAVILSHNGTAFIFTLLLGSYLLFLLAMAWWQGKRQGKLMSEVQRRPSPSLTSHAWLLIGAALITALGLSAIFWLPMVTEQRFIKVEQWTSVSYDYQRHFIYPSQFLSPYWGYGYSGEGLLDDMSFQLGVVPLVLALTTVVIALRCNGRNRAHVGFFGLVTLILLFAMSPASASLWKGLPITALIQFPWRLLALTTITTSILAGAVVHHLAPQGAADDLNPLVGLLLVITILASREYLLPQYTDPSPRSEQPVAIIDFETFSYRDRVGMTSWVTEQPQTTPLVPEYLAGKRLTKAVALTEGATVEMIRHGGASEKVRIRSDREATVQFRTYYFPGWRGYVDGQEVAIRPEGPQALITLEVPTGEHEVEIRFGDTPIRLVGKAISILSLSAALLFLVWSRKK
ncbi:MAG: 6-pyruvoyl-tetrahydropterin synthase-related protein [Anaerolineae bacterium]